LALCITQKQSRKPNEIKAFGFAVGTPVRPKYECGSSSKRVHPHRTIQPIKRKRAADLSSAAPQPIVYDGREAQVHIGRGHLHEVPDAPGNDIPVSLQIAVFPLRCAQHSRYGLSDRGLLCNHKSM